MCSARRCKLIIQEENYIHISEEEDDNYDNYVHFVRECSCYVCLLHISFPRTGSLHRLVDDLTVQIILLLLTKYYLKLVLWEGNSGEQPSVQLSWVCWKCYSKFQLKTENACQVMRVQSKWKYKEGKTGG